jgi:hypothetical protein
MNVTIPATVYGIAALSLLTIGVYLLYFIFTVPFSILFLGTVLLAGSFGYNYGQLWNTTATG